MLRMNITKLITRATKSEAAKKVEHIQDLWSGYGTIDRYELVNATIESVVAKHIHFPGKKHHPRGWNTDLSHKRKLKSYQVEIAWYKNYSQKCNDTCKVPQCYFIEQAGDEVIMVFEDLDLTGFSKRKLSVNWPEFEAVVSWLANFHATFIGQPPEKLWKNGSYWHLDTRPEELKALDDLQLKQAAAKIDLKLKKSPFLTLIHGDAKLANFCFSDNGSSVAAVDFQYVGGGCGMKDLAYFVGSCFDENSCESLEKQILDCYFLHLKQALENRGNQLIFNELEENWRSLYPVAWTDFHRFIKGWSPGHWKINSYSEKVAQKTISLL